MRPAAIGISLALAAVACAVVTETTPTPEWPATVVEPVGTPSLHPTSSLTQSTATPEAGVGSPEQVEVPFGYRFLQTPEELAGREVVVYLDPETGRFNYVTWDGDTGPLLEVELPRFDIAPVSYQARFVILTVPQYAIDPWPGWHLYVFDLQEKRAWGYATGCPGDGFVVDQLAGLQYLTYECGDGRLRFVSLDSPSTLYIWDLPAEVEKGYVPLWFSSGEILLLRSRDRMSYCMAQVEAWEPECHTVPFRIGALSPNNEWVEVREGEFPTPQSIGVWPGRCLRDPLAADCEPQWVRTNGVIARWPPPYDADHDRRWIGRPGAWLPDGSSLIVLNAETFRAGTDLSRDIRVGSDPWILHRKDMSLQLLRRIPFSQVGYPSAGNEGSLPIFSPAGDYLLVEDYDYVGAQKAGGPLYMVSVTGQQNRALLERAGLRIGTLLLP